MMNDMKKSDELNRPGNSGGRSRSLEVRKIVGDEKPHQQFST